MTSLSSIASAQQSDDCQQLSCANKFAPGCYKRQVQVLRLETALLFGHTHAHTHTHTHTRVPSSTRNTQRFTNSDQVQDVHFYFLVDNILLRTNITYSGLFLFCLHVSLL